MQRRNRRSQVEKDAEALLHHEHRGELMKRGQKLPQIEDGIFFKEEIERADRMAKESPHAGISSLTYFDQLKKFQRRKIHTFLDPELVEKEIFFSTDRKDKQPAHPFLRKMVSVQSTAFKQAVHLVAKAIVTAKNDHRLVTYLQCCDIFWIGVHPKMTTHCFNDKFRKYMDLRNIPKACYNPDFLPGCVQEETQPGPEKPKLVQPIQEIAEEFVTEERPEAEEPIEMDLETILSTMKEKEDLMSTLQTAATQAVDEDGDLITDQLPSKPIERIWEDIDSEGEEVAVLG